MSLQLISSDDLRLHQISEAVKEITSEVVDLLHAMKDTMYETKGIGIAAVQVGHLLRLVVIDVDHRNAKHAKEADKKSSEEPKLLHGGKPIFMINPEIVEKSPEMVTFCEGCLSLPGFKTEMNRHASVVVNYLDIKGEHHHQKLDGILAICMQHEIDHLNGKLISDENF